MYQLPDGAVEKFESLWRKHFEEDLGSELARKKAQGFFNLMVTLIELNYGHGAEKLGPAHTISESEARLAAMRFEVDAGGE